MADPLGEVEPEKRIFFRQEALVYNLKRLEMLHIVVAIAAGCIAGILGLTSYRGLILFVIVALLTLLGVLFKMGFSSSKYILNSLLQLELSMFMGQALTYILFWTFAYAIVHIY